MNRAPQKHFGTKLAPLAFLFFGQVVSPGVPPKDPAPDVAFNQPAAAFHLAAESPEARSMLLAGGALMILGLVRRRRKAD